MIKDITNVSITLKEFKAFFYWSLGKSKTFIDTIWNTIWKDSQRQVKDVMDWAAYVEHLQTVFQKFDINAVISKPVLICLFRNCLKPSIYS